MDGPFNGFTIPDKRGGGGFIYRPSTKQHIAHNCCADEVFYGGAVFGGKSFWIITHTAMHCMAWGSDANTVAFRRTYDELEGSIIEEFRRIFDGRLGVYKDNKHVFEWSNGARTWFRHLERWADVQKHFSKQYTLIAFDELTHFEKKQYLYLFMRLRSPRNKAIHPQIISASNPRGMGHKWVKERFVDALKPNTVYRFNQKMDDGSVTAVTRCYVPARATDNKGGLENDPLYLARMKSALSDDVYRAFVGGDWGFFEGVAFPEWDERIHVIEPFPIPSNWPVIRAMDWGYASPFSVGWWARDPETSAIYRVDEWYGVRRSTSGGVRGLELSASEFRDQLWSRERANIDAGAFPLPRYGVADPSIWRRMRGELTTADIINSNRPLFTKAKNDRVYGKQILHQLLRINPVTGLPGLMSFNTNDAWNSQFPKLMLDENNPEDVETKKQEDHAYDEGRYGVVALHEGWNELTPWQIRAKTRRLTRMPRAI